MASRGSRKSGCVSGRIHPQSQAGFVCLVICFVNKRQCIVNNSLLNNYATSKLLVTTKYLSRSQWPLAF